MREKPVVGLSSEAELVKFISNQGVWKVERNYWVSVLMVRRSMLAEMGSPCFIAPLIFDLNSRGKENVC